MIVNVNIQSCKDCDSCILDPYYFGYVCKQGQGNVTKYVQKEKKPSKCPKFEKLFPIK